MSRRGGGPTPRPLLSAERAHQRAHCIVDSLLKWIDPISEHHDGEDQGEKWRSLLKFLAISYGFIFLILMPMYSAKLYFNYQLNLDLLEHVTMEKMMTITLQCFNLFVIASFIATVCFAKMVDNNKCSFENIDGDDSKAHKNVKGKKRVKKTKMH